MIRPYTPKLFFLTFFYEIFHENAQRSGAFGEYV
jgi:hypothetical protein